MLWLLLLHVTVAVAMPITAASILHLIRQYIDCVRAVHAVRQHGAFIRETRAAAAVAVAVEKGQQQRSKNVIDTNSITLYSSNPVSAAADVTRCC